jgi:dienelactone hydrolase
VRGRPHQPTASQTTRATSSTTTTAAPTINGTFDLVGSSGVLVNAWNASVLPLGSTGCLSDMAPTIANGATGGQCHPAAGQDHPGGQAGSDVWPGRGGARWLYRRRMGAGRVLTLAAVALLTVLGCAVAGHAGQPAPTVSAPQQRYAVAVRTIGFSRGADRPLPTTVWYPAEGRGPAAGRHPLVLFSHGLGGLPEDFAGLATGWAAAGFVVAAPAYPHTNGRTTVSRADLRNQPADAAYVLRRLRDLGPGDPLARHIDPGDVAAVGFSAGGYTTMGLFGPGHDPALRAAVVISAREAPGPFGGAPSPMLFLHGDADRVVPIEADRAAFASVPWPKRFVMLPGRGHGEFLDPGHPGFAQVSELILTFLRDRLYARTPVPAPRMSGL